jgi:hypothetical protein
LTIAWTILLLSKHDLNRAVDLVIGWLESAEEARKRMGQACTKQLFNFYGADGLQTTPEEHSPLLRLLVPFMEIKPNYSEFSRILLIILEWAKDTAWSERLLTHPDGEASELLTALSHVNDSGDVEWITGRINYREAMLRLQTLFLQLQLPLQAFIHLVNEIIDWIQAENERINLLRKAQKQASKAERSRRSAPRRGKRGVEPDIYEPKPLPHNITADTATQLLELVGLNKDNQDMILAEINRHERKMLYDKTYRRNHPTMVRNLKTVMDNIRLQLYNKDGILPPLPENGYYGLILFDVAGRDASVRDTIPKTAADFVRHLFKEKNGEKIVPVMHRLGRREVVYTYPKERPKKIKINHADLWPKNLPRSTPLIGPILQRYDTEQVAFVVLIIASPIYDVDDWSENPEWQPRLFAHTLNPRAQPRGIQPLPIGNEMEAIVKEVLNKTLRS